MQSEQKIKQMLEKELDKNTYELTTNLSLRAEGEGGRTQLDFAIKNKKTGKLTVMEVKSSETASFTRNQKKHLPKIQNQGVEIVGGKGRKMDLLPGDLVDSKKIHLHVIRPEQMKKVESGEMTLVELLGL